MEPVLNQPSRVLFVAAFDEDGVVVAGPERRRLDDHADESVAVSSQESSAVFVRFFFFFFFFLKIRMRMSEEAFTVSLGAISLVLLQVFLSASCLRL